MDGLKHFVTIDKLNRIADNLTKFTAHHKQADDLNEPRRYSLGEIVEKICLDSKGSIMPENSKYLIQRNIIRSKLHEDDKSN